MANELDFAMFGGMIDQTTFYVLLICSFVVFLFGALLFLYWFVNRSASIPMKIDIRGRSTGLIKRLPYRAQIFMVRGSSGVWVNDKWGPITVDGEKHGYLKFAGFDFPAPKYKDLQPGNFLMARSPNFGELYPLVMNQETNELEAKIEYDMVGHCYKQLRSNASTFAKKSNWEALLPYVALAGITFAGLAMLFIVGKMQTDQLAATGGAIQGAAQGLTEAVNRIAGNSTFTKPPV
jgi:hypothetical protein